MNDLRPPPLVLVPELIPHSTERKTGTGTLIFVVSKEEQLQSLHYSNLFPQEYYTVKFPATITKIDTEYERAKIPPYNGSDPTSPLEV